MLKTRIDGRFLALDYASDDVNIFSSTLEEWLSLAETKTLLKVSYAEKYPMKSRFKLPRRFKVSKKYAIRTGADREVVIHRSWNEIKALRLDLVEGFSGAFVPNLPDSKVKNALNLFFGFLTSNPYFRNDKSIQSFLDPNVPCFIKWLKMTKKNGNNFENIGRKRWLQALCKEKGKRTRNFSDNVFYYEKIKEEFNLVLSFLLELKKTVKVQMEILEKQALSFNNLHDSLTNMLSVESNLEELFCQNTEDLQDVSMKTAKAVNTQTNLLCKQYGAPMLKKRVLFELDQEISIIKTWLKHMKQIEQMAKLLSELERKIDSEQKQKTLIALVKRYSYIELKLCILYQGLLGIELNNFRNRRVEVLKQILQNLTNFHILGAQRTFNNWNYDNRTTIYETFLDKFDMLEARISKSRKVQNQVDRVQNNNLVLLQLVQRLKKRSNYFKKDGLFDISVGDKLFGRAITENGVKMFECVNARGQRGLVPTDNVAVLSELNDAITGADIGIASSYNSKPKDKRKQAFNQIKSSEFEPFIPDNKIGENFYSHEKTHYSLPENKNSRVVHSPSKTISNNRSKQFVKKQPTFMKDLDEEVLNPRVVRQNQALEKVVRKPSSDREQLNTRLVRENQAPDKVVRKPSSDREQLNTHLVRENQAPGKVVRKLSSDREQLNTRLVRENQAPGKVVRKLSSDGEQLSPLLVRENSASDAGRSSSDEEELSPLLVRESAASDIIGRCSSDGEQLSPLLLRDNPISDVFERKSSSESLNKKEKVILRKVPFGGQAPVCSTILEDIRQSNFSLKSVHDRVLKPEVVEEENDFFAELKKRIQKHRLNLIENSSMPDDASSLSLSD